jgi:putative autoinducer-2 (AI-2) aldolase
MPEADDSKHQKNNHVDNPATSEPFFLKGSNNLDWGKKNHMSSIFDPKTGRTVMLAFDHGYFQGKSLASPIPLGITMSQNSFANDGLS